MNCDYLERVGRADRYVVGLRPSVEGGSFMVWDEARDQIVSGTLLQVGCFAVEAAQSIQNGNLQPLVPYLKRHPRRPGTYTIQYEVPVMVVALSTEGGGYRVLRQDDELTELAPDGNAVNFTENAQADRGGEGVAISKLALLT